MKKKKKEEAENVKGNLKWKDNQEKNPEISQMLKLLVKVFIVHYNWVSWDKWKILRVNKKEVSSTE